MELKQTHLQIYLHGLLGGSSRHLPKLIDLSLAFHYLDLAIQITWYCGLFFGKKKKKEWKASNIATLFECYHENRTPPGNIQFEPNMTLSITMLRALWLNSSLRKGIQMRWGLWRFYSIISPSPSSLKPVLGIFEVVQSNVHRVGTGPIPISFYYSIKI